MIAFAVAVVALCAAAAPPAAARDLQQAQGPAVVGTDVTLTGQAIVTTVDLPNRQSDKMLSLRVNKRHLHVRGVSRQLIDEIQPGQVITVVGEVMEVTDSNDDEDEEEDTPTVGVVIGEDGPNNPMKGKGNGKFKKDRVKEPKRARVKALRASRIMDRNGNGKKKGAEEIDVAAFQADQAATVDEPPLVTDMPEAQNGRRLQGVRFANIPAALWQTLPIINPELNVVFIPISFAEVPGAVPATACPNTVLPAVGRNQLRATYFQEFNTRSTTVGSTFSECSLGRTLLREGSSWVAPLVQLPCSGYNDYMQWSTQKCGYEDTEGYAAAADAALRARNFPVDSYDYKVYLIPPTSACNFVGMAYMGCDRTVFACKAWIGGAWWRNAQAYSHELGHNLFLGHAGSFRADFSFDEYLDETCMMGYCCNNRCPNAPHTWQLGWRATLQLNGTNMGASTTFNFGLGSQHSFDRAVVRINPTWAPGIHPLFISYRLGLGGDDQLLADFADEVHIYTAPTIDQFDPAPSTYRASLQVGQVYVNNNANIVVRRLPPVRANVAAIQICRRGGFNETLASCLAERDNNCDGLAGADDPFCVGLLPPVAV